MLIIAAVGTLKRAVSACFFVLAVALIGGAVPGVAGTDDYPSSIAGCRYVSMPHGTPFTANLKGSKQDTLIDPWGEYNRECTSFVAFRLSSRNGFTMPWNDDALNWKADAIRSHYTVNSTPAVGAIAWWSIGHVAWVESVNGPNVTVEDYNSGYPYVYPKNPGNYAERTVSTNSVSGFIHFRDMPTQDRTPPLGAIDAPYKNGLTASGSATVFGWANDGHGQQSNLQSIQLLLDGNSMGPVSYPVWRSDGQLGFQLSWDTTRTPDGAHTVTLHLVSKAGVTFDLSRTVIVSNAVSALPYPHTLGANQILWAGQSICSDNFRFVLTMQNDGNLVVYARSPGGETPIWASNTQGHPGALAIMQNDGNFVVCDSTWRPLWASGSRVANSYLIMQDDGNLVVYTSGGRPVWATNT